MKNLNRAGINSTHGATRDGKRSPEYITWLSMRQRCGDPNHRNYKNYGAKGVRVCEQWQLSFEAFLSDMGPKPSSNHSLDRIDPRLGYEPDNCRWADNKTQQNNRLNNSTMMVDGVRMTGTQIAEKIGVPAKTVLNRIAKFNEGLLTAEDVMTPGNRTHKLLPTGETITQAAKRLGVWQGSISYRMRRVAAGLMTIDQALGTRSLRSPEALR